MAVSFGFRAGSLALGSGGGGSEPTLITKNITENDTYSAADDGADGYSSVTVNVQPNVGTKSITGNGTYKASDDNLDGYSEVSVNVAGLSGIVVMDFTNITTPFTLNGVSYGSTGAVFDGTSDYIALSYFHAGMELEIDVGSMSVSANRRFVTSYENRGLIYYSGKWGFYNGSWYYSDITDGSYFSNSTVKIVVDSQNYWHIYKDGILVFEPTGALVISNPQIGSRDGLAIDSCIITGIRMKEITT